MLIISIPTLLNKRIELSYVIGHKEHNHEEYHLIDG